MEFKSSIGKTKVNSGEGMKVFSVPNEEGQNFDAEFEQQMSGFDQQMPAPGQRLSFEEANQIRANWTKKAQQNQENFEEKFIERVEYITGIARGKREVTVEVNGKKTVWTLRTLKRGEQLIFAGFLQAMSPIIIGDKVSAKITDTMELKKIALKYSLYQLDGTSINTVLGTDGWPHEKQMWAKELMIEEMDEALVEYLYSEFEVLSSEHNKRFSLKNKEDVAGVADAISKSSKGSKA